MESKHDFIKLLEDLEAKMAKERKARIAQRKKQEEEFKNSDFGKIYSKLSQEERNTWAMYTLAGSYDYMNNTVLMGKEAYEKVKNFEEKMIQKYNPVIFDPGEINSISLQGTPSLYRDGGSISVDIKRFDFSSGSFITDFIVINNAIGGDGEWYRGWPREGGIRISEGYKERIISEITRQRDAYSNMMDRIIDGISSKK